MDDAGNTFWANTDELQDDLKSIENLCMMDDVLMRKVFRDNLPLAQYVLRAMTGVG